MIRGIDVSQHNGELDVAKIKQSGVSFIIIRTSYGMYYEDQQFRRTVAKCEVQKMPYGFYHYSYARNLKEAEQEVAGMLASIAGKHPSYPVYIDMEDSDYWKKNNGNPSNEVYQEICEYFCKRVEEAGYYAGIYANLDWLKNRLRSPRLDRFDKWVAQWSAACTYDLPYGMWQYSSNGKVNGSSLRTDMNYALIDYPSLIHPLQKEETYLKIGDMVNVIVNRSYDGVPLIEAVLHHTYPVIEIGNDRVVLGGGLNTAFHIHDICKQDTSPTLSNQIRVTDRVRVVEGALDIEGKALASFVYQQIYEVMEISGDRVVIGQNGMVTAAVHMRDLRVS
ncbi:hypothetical protein GSF08_09755 [Clostridiaceae bacterium DONG20-135]|uniref:Lysozyme n=1 Tax=Copranaerobaculum intestinale TaxID=2692629 RepID=A0A6N8U8P1_9FIRM|nr:glycoside hydrolase family 25 protein [Copranaerobaculum intestinale]MXQ74220.1 hypothetical protein [Copranaerobaculum intestinale]